MNELGKPIYNIECVIAEGTEKLMPRSIYDASVSVIEKAGLLGKHHVTEKGYFLKGFADVKESHVAGFDIFYRAGLGDATAMDICQKIKSQSNYTSGTVAEERADIAEICGELISKDPLASALPWNIYSQLPSIVSRTISTPAGIQNIHYHLNSGIPVRLFKPKYEACFFDIDVLSNYFGIREIRLSQKAIEIEMKNQEAALRAKNWSAVGLLTMVVGSARQVADRFTASKLEKKAKKCSEFEQILLTNPDSVEVVSFSIADL
jgi:hypothetical protein